jgi:hypothetical protein
LIAGLARLEGPEAVAKMIPLLPAELGRAVKLNSFLSGGWYPIEDYRLLHAAMQKVTGRGPDISYQVGKDATLEDFRGIYRILTFVLSPEFLMKRSGPLFNRYYDTGKLTILEAKRGMGRAHFTGCTGFNRALWEDTIGGTMGILEACGAKDVAWNRLEGGGDGDDHLLLTATWS